MTLHSIYMNEYKNITAKVTAKLTVKETARIAGNTTTEPHRKNRTPC